MWLGFEQRWRQVLLSAVLPAGPRHRAAGDLDLLEFWHVFGRTAPPDLRLAWRASVWLLTLLPLLWLRPPMPALSPEQRQRFLVQWADSPVYWLRQVVVLLKTVAAWGALQDPETRAALAIDAGQQS